jgi:hypothetical protein
VLATVQDGAQQTVDTLGQYATAPRAFQYLTQGIPCLPELSLSQPRGSLIQAGFPQVSSLCLGLCESYHGTKWPVGNLFI